MSVTECSIYITFQKYDCVYVSRGYECVYVCEVCMCGMYVCMYVCMYVWYVCVYVCVVYVWQREIDTDLVLHLIR